MSTGSAKQSKLKFFKKKGNDADDTNSQQIGEETTEDPSFSGNQKKRLRTEEEDF